MFKIRCKSVLNLAYVTILYTDAGWTARRTNTQVFFAVHWTDN